MRFLVDAQLPPSLTQFLRTFGEEAIACRDVGLRDACAVRDGNGGEPAGI